MRPAEDLGDEEWVTQKISRNREDIDSPRACDPDGVSVIRGRITPAEAYARIVKGGKADSEDGARYATVGDLRANGFTVTHSPTRRNRDHTSISREGGWNHSDAAAFVSCFTEYAWHEPAKHLRMEEK